MSVLLLASTDAPARALLAHALREEYAMDALPPIARGPWGKPFFPDRPHIYFSLSHSGPYALCAVGGEEVGADIEEVRPRGPGLPRAVLTDREYAWYEENGADWPAFYTLWTRKESFCKREGRGVVRPRAVCPPLPGEDCKVITLSTLTGPRWRAAVCSHEPIPPIRWLEF